MTHLVTLALSLLFVVSSFADTVQQAEELFAKRGQDVSFANQAAEIYAKLAQAAAGQERAKLLVKQTEAIYYVGTKTEEDSAREKVHERGEEIAAQAVELSQGEDELQARALFWEGANMGKAAEARGVLASLGQWPTLKKKMQKIIKLKQAAVEDYGAYRVLGRAYYKLPSPLGSNKKSLKYLKAAYEKTEGRHGLNNLFYAESLIAEKEKSTAREILQKFVDADALTLNPKRIPETQEEQEEARELLSDL